MYDEAKVNTVLILAQKRRDAELKKTKADTPVLHLNHRETPEDGVDQSPGRSGLREKG